VNELRSLYFDKWACILILFSPPLELEIIVLITLFLVNSSLKERHELLALQLWV